MSVQNKRAVSAYFARCAKMWRTSHLSWQHIEIFGVTTWSAVSIWQVEGKDGWILQCTGQPPVTQTYSGASLVAQWIRIHQPMQGTQVWSLVQEGSTCWGATKPASHTYWDHVLQLLKPTCPTAYAPQWEKPPQWEAFPLQQRLALACRNQRKSTESNEDPALPKIKQLIN